MRKRLLLFGLPASVVVIAVVVWLLWPRTAITRENAAKITAGMTLAEVEAILGPPRDDSTGPASVDLKHFNREEPLLVLRGVADRILELDASGRVRRWTSDRVGIHVLFDAGGRVTDVEAFPLVRTQESLLDTLRRWLRM
jgi:hypothetical protein